MPVKPKLEIKKITNNPLAKPTVKLSFFDNDDEEDSEESSSAKKTAPYNTQITSNRIKKQTQIELEKAISQDPNVFEYDAVYDELEKEKNKLNPKLKSLNESKEVTQLTSSSRLV